MEEGDSNSNNSSLVGDDDGSCPMIVTMAPPSHHHLNNFTPNNQNHYIPPPSSSSTAQPNPTTGCFVMDIDNHGVPSFSSSCQSFSSVKAKIVSHPLYQRLIAAYANCQKVGAPPEVVTKLEEACTSAEIVGGVRDSIGVDPLLDQFMEAYCEMLTKYEQELSKPFNDAMLFLQRIESQFKTITLSPPNSYVLGDAMERNASSEDDAKRYGFIDPSAEDGELKCLLLRKYSGYIGSLKQEFTKKRKKGKLPKEAREQLLDWWSRHYKWPYPSESQKLELAESSGLDQKQINNWFINQRKRHWKPTEDTQFVLMDAAHHQYLDNPFLMDLSSPSWSEGFRNNFVS